ncbi:MAG: YceI family protein [bacterium]|nr:YceI family protein [bacterium]MCP4967968.1 YceI family protein [bacterium]
MNKRNIVIGLVGAAVVLAGAVWYFFLRSDAPPPATLEGAVEAVTGETTTTSGDGEPAATTAAPSTTSAPATSGGLDGSWTADPSLSFVGYRIEEELASIGSVTAVGRTSEVDATLTFAGFAVTDLLVTIDMTTLQSDRSRRDGAMATRGLETTTFPEASFVLTSPIDLGAVPADGESIGASATGDLTLHGVTQSISLDLEGTLVEGTMVVVGSVDVALTDYGIEKPTGFSVLSIADVGVLEIQLALVRS